ncbi:hypothetical protein [Phreatobacter cathodiphilus]|uniref:PepSY domain-containing protein n=1 Tax=Phreatobacter cathodiphilus TaxID=1868589 RepID=A0A2S0N7G8_9HYPH|nr:hypothetical protein [Phreatobacter cathodiphilus]AVO44109.1 hypothetical protein C6569_02985 [Phreatobacter cathodiphilus]
MKTILSAAAALAIAGTAALAQTTAPGTTPPAAPTTTPSAPAPGAGTPSAPAATTTARAVNAAPLENGANSFTEGQASERFREAGITGVTGLAKDDNGVWRGRGQYQGRSVEIGLDYRGNIQAR